jgi:hypothetical protein
MNGSPEALLESPQVLIAEEEKIIVEEVQGTRTVVEERYILFSFMIIQTILFIEDWRK